MDVAPAFPLLLLFLTGISLWVVEAEVHYHDFVVAEKNFTRLCKTKSMLVVNGQFPGPTIYVHKGDTVFVNVHNHGDYGLTVHWHGVRQPRNPWSDGSAYITQCPIQPAKNFTYEVVFSEEEGTLWWHANSNSDWTRNTVHGAIVVYPRGSSYPFPTPQGEQVLMFGTWFTYDVNKVIKEILRTGKDVPISDAFIINGQPGDFCACSKEMTYRWRVDYGKTYLIRLVNALMNEEFFFAIAGHDLTVVGIDGSYLKPFTTSYVMLATGQTMDVLIKTNQSPGRYYMVGRQYYTDNLAFTGYDKTNATAILEYRGRYNRPSSVFFPDTLPSYTDYDSATRFRKRLKSLASNEHPIRVPRNITTRMYITASMDRIVHADMDYTLLSSLNNISWVNPSTDVLQAYYRNLSGFYTSDFPDEPPYYFDFVADLGDTSTHPLKGKKVKILEYGEEVEIVFQSTNLLNASDEHSMYIHGHKYYVLGEGYGNFNSATDPETYNLVDPPYLSTASLPVKGWVAIRFTANNPGVWAMHCQEGRHLIWGMNTVLIVKNGSNPETNMRSPPPNMPSCQSSLSILGGRALEVSAE
ncbi:laccase 14 [Hibiscus trionum]|uniref:Laccase n=1 Tax=Hibiscus trionum TaxID=183268 RepID=A0A9W7IWH9_HIBTR|nr:laccase 14 [Hibiscus trionum]